MSGLTSTRLSVAASLMPSNSRLPSPRAIGNIISRYSSTSPRSVSPRTRLALPATRMSPPSCSLSAVTSWARSPLRIVELFQSACVSVWDTTYLGMLFILSAKPTSSVRPGHAWAKPS